MLRHILPACIYWFTAWAWI